MTEFEFTLWILLEPRDSARHSELGLAMLAEVGEWENELSVLTDRLSRIFKRPEPRAACEAFVRALLADVPRKNSWELAKHAQYATARPFEHLLNGAVWDVEALRSVVRDLIIDGLGSAEAIAVISETCAPKQGIRSVGVARQSYGQSGPAKNCQLWVMLTLASARGDAFIDRELFLPTSWTDSQERMTAAGVPAGRGFLSRPALAVFMVDRALAESVAFRWVAAGPEYSHDLTLREYCHEKALPYLLAMAEEVALMTSSRGDLADAFANIARSRRQPHSEYHSSAIAGSGIWTWAMNPVRLEDQRPAPGFAHWLLLGRPAAGGTSPRSTPSSATNFFLVHAPVQTKLADAASGAALYLTATRDDTAKLDLCGLNHYQVRKWNPTYRHITICMLAAALHARAQAGP